MEPGLIAGDDGRLRCWWSSGADYAAYHDHEWGLPSADEGRLFEKLSLEGFQAGLSWLTILRKRENFRRAFADFDIDQVASFGKVDVARLLADAGIVRHRGKIEATINNATRALALRTEFGSLAAYVWRWEPKPADRPRRITRNVLMELTESPQSIAMSKDLKKRGWRFVGPTTVYSFMQAMGLVNDHITGCQMRDEVRLARAAFTRP
ncbi:MAG: DNA-3-methyladenine glycosylase I [Acidimicrobiia bacterium]